MIANVVVGTLLDIRLTWEHGSRIISNLQQQEKMRYVIVNNFHCEPSTVCENDSQFVEAFEHHGTP